MRWKTSTVVPTSPRPTASACTWRLESNAEHYDGVRYAWLDVAFDGVPPREGLAEGARPERAVEEDEDYRSKLSLRQLEELYEKERAERERKEAEQREFGLKVGARGIERSPPMNIAPSAPRPEVTPHAALVQSTRFDPPVAVLVAEREDAKHKFNLAAKSDPAERRAARASADARADAEATAARDAALATAVDAACAEGDAERRAADVAAAHGIARAHRVD